MPTGHPPAARKVPPIEGPPFRGFVWQKIVRSYPTLTRAFHTHLCLSLTRTRADSAPGSPRPVGDSLSKLLSNRSRTERQADLAGTKVDRPQQNRTLPVPAAVVNQDQLSSAGALSAELDLIAEEFRFTVRLWKDAKLTSA
jgi:hypothetical protein